MKKLRLAGLAAIAALAMSSCATVKAPLSGYIYTNVKSPVAVTSNTGGSKVGTAKATSILGWVATGDASIKAAALAGGITRIQHVDEHATNILGIVATYEVTVYGD